MIDFQLITEGGTNKCVYLPILLANIGEDVSGWRIKCTDFEGFTPTS